MKTVKLGDLIEIYEIRNSENKQYEFLGINKDKVFMPSVANTDFVDARKYKIIKKDMFVFSGMQTGRDMCIRIGLYTDEIPGLLSPAYTTFVVKDKTQILPEYLFLLFNRTEMDRFGAYLSDGSVRANLDWEIFIDIEIPLPDLETQRQIVASYNGLKNVIDDNLALVEPLEKLCHASISECKKNYRKIPLQGLIQRSMVNNSDLKYGAEYIEGVCNERKFSKTKIDPNSVNLKPYKYVNNGDFVYNPTVVDKGSIAFRKEGFCIVSHLYVVFHLTEEGKKLFNPEFLFIYFTSRNFLEHITFLNFGSQRAEFKFCEFEELSAPCPPLEVQQSIVNIFNCAQEAKKIANEAKEELKKLCPALVQFASKSA